jgi:hypothetical protein
MGHSASTTPQRTQTCQSCMRINAGVSTSARGSPALAGGGMAIAVSQRTGKRDQGVATDVETPGGGRGR